MVKILLKPIKVENQMYGNKGLRTTTINKNGFFER